MRSIYPLRALTGQWTSSSGERSFRLARKNGPGVNHGLWFLSSTRAGSSRTPPGSILRWPGSTLQAWIQLLLRPEASWRRKAVLIEISLKVAADKGSKGVLLVSLRL